MASIRKLFIITSISFFPLLIGLNSHAQELVTNGNFETGNTSGWSVSTDCAEATGGVAVIEAYTGTKAPIIYNTILAPPQGIYAAISDFNGTATASTALYQEIAVPSNQSVSCSLIYYYNSFGELISRQGLECDENNNQTARIDIMKPGSGAFDTGDGVLENLYQTEPADPMTPGYTTLNFDLTEYAGSTIGLSIATAPSFSGVLQFMVDDVTCSTGLGEEPEPQPPMGEGNGSPGGCGSLAPSTGSYASLPVYLLIPAFILIARLWRRRTNQKHT
jgi:hypothetical protein